MGYKRFSGETASYRALTDTAAKRGSATFAGEQRQREGKKLDPLVDPSANGLIRRSIGYREKQGSKFVLLNGVAMTIEDRLDTTGSMGGNVDIAMRVLPTAYALYTDHVLKRYDPQIITGIFNDMHDRDDYSRDIPVICRSQAEMGVKIAEQMTLMVPGRRGGDAAEDPHYGIFGGAFLTSAEINNYGLKYYDFTITDAPGRNGLELDVLLRVFGPTVFDKVKENGFTISKGQLPSTADMVTELGKRAHAFLLQVEDHGETTHFWKGVYDSAHIVKLPRTELLAYVKAAIIGLTEGTLDLQSLEEFLRGKQLSKGHASAIVRAVLHIPIGAQTSAPNFNKIPARGAVFDSKTALWPIGEATPVVITSEKPVVDTPIIVDDDGEETMWL